MKKVLCLSVFMALLLVGFVYGRGAGEEAKAAEEITLTGMVRDYNLKQDAPWYTAVKTFAETHPNVKFELEGLPYNDQREKVLITVGAGKGPDVAQVDCIWLGEFASNKIIIDITEKVNADPDLKNDYLPVFFSSSQWQGKTYGLWLNSDVRMHAWHKAFFKDAGLDPVVPPKTWTELRAFGKKLNRPDEGVWGYAFPAFSTDHTADRWYPFLRMGKGGDILSKDFTKATFNSKAGIDALQLFVDLMNTDKVSPTDLLGIKEGDTSNGFIAEKYAMHNKCGSYYRSYRDKGLSKEQYKEKIGMAALPIPAGGKPATGSGGWLLSVTRDSKHPDLALEFLKLVVSPDNVLPFLTDRAMVPTRKSLMAKEKEFFEAAPYFNIVQEITPYTHFRPPVPEYTKISGEIVTAIQKALTLEATPKEALDKAAEKSNQILAKRKW